MYESTFIDKLFEALIQKQRKEKKLLEKGTLMSLLKTIKEGRYNNKEVLMFLFE